MMIQNHKKTILFLFVWAFCAPIFGQIKLYPLTSSPIQKNARIEDDSVTLYLPFFEDFSGYTGSPNPALWERGGGTQVNHSYTNEAPSINIVTFDGTDERGMPYNFIAPRTADLADELVSRPLDFSKLISGSDIYMSFYWQSEGLGEVPDSTDGDFLELQFLNDEGEWITQWKQYGQPNSGFQYEIFRIGSDEYLHEKFQFRFRTFNRLSGSYDVWNLDYIYIDKNRKLEDKFVVDIAVTGRPTSYLKNYRSMPINQFFANEVAETAEEITVTASNLHDKFNILNYQVFLRDAFAGDTLEWLIDSTDIISGQQKYLLFSTTADTLPRDREKLILEYDFLLNTGNLDPIPTVNLRQNDTISGRTVLDDYYAYDDGNAEYGIGIQQRFGKLAYEFSLNEPDLLTHVDFSFVRLGEDLTGETFNLYIWKALDFTDGADADSLLLVQNIVVKYPNTPNEFTRVQLSRPLSLSEKFYIGFEQLTEKDLTFGFDRNTNSVEKAYYNVANKWEQNLDIFGSIMMRPVFGNSGLTTSIEESEIPSMIQNQFGIYPNPTSGTVFVKGNVETMRIYNLQGRIVMEKKFTSFEPTQEIQFPKNLANGMYLIELQGKKQNVRQKCILMR